MIFMSNIDIVNVGDSPILKVSYVNVPLQVLIISDQEIVNHRKQRSLDTFGTHCRCCDRFAVTAVLKQHPHF